MQILNSLRHPGIAFFVAIYSVSLSCHAQEPASTKQPVFDAQTRLDWHAQHLEMQRSTPFKELKWKHIGPSHMSGRVTDIAKPLDQPFTFYVTTASGGVWKTVNEGTTWQPIFDDAPSAAWGAIAVDPNDSNTIWIGGGESKFSAPAWPEPAFIVSHDAGKTLGTHGSGRHAPHRPDHRASHRFQYRVCGCRRSLNTRPMKSGAFSKRPTAGVTWNKVLYESDLVGGNDVVIDPHNPNNVYASMWHRIRRPWSDPVPADGGGIYKSTDGGETWKRKTVGLPPRETSGRIGICPGSIQSEQDLRVD